MTLRGAGRCWVTSCVTTNMGKMRSWNALACSFVDRVLMRRANALREP